MRSSVSGTTVVLGWTAPTELVPVSYIIEAGSSSGAIDQAYFEMPADATSYTALGVPAGVYFVRVRARAADGQISAASNETIVAVGVSMSACSPVSAPSGLTIVVDGSTVTLTWGAGAGAGSYVIEAGSAAGLTNLANFDTQNPGLGYTAYGVGSGTYFVRVRSKNACGVSGPSNEVPIIVGR
jgi:hypothetical protein